MTTLRIRMNLRVMPMDGYSTLPKAQEVEPRH